MDFRQLSVSSGNELSEEVLAITLKLFKKLRQFGQRTKHKFCMQCQLFSWQWPGSNANRSHASGLGEMHVVGRIPYHHDIVGCQTRVLEKCLGHTDFRLWTMAGIITGQKSKIFKGLTQITTLNNV